MSDTRIGRSSSGLNVYLDTSSGVPIGGSFAPSSPDGIDASRPDGILGSGRSRRIPGVRATEKDNGKTITVPRGQNFLLSLPENGSTGYQWKVVGTDRTFGYPASNEYVGPASGRRAPIGSGGTRQMIWKTDGFLNQVGTHHLRLEYRRPWESASKPAAKTFEIDVKVTEGSSPSPSPSSKLSAAKRKQILAAFQKMDRAGLIDWQNSGVPLGVRMYREPLMSERHPDGYSYSALIPIGALTPTAPKGDPNKSKQFYLERTGGLAGWTQIAGPFNLK